MSPLTSIRPQRALRAVRAVLVLTALGALVAGGLAAHPSSSSLDSRTHDANARLTAARVSTNPVTPGNFTGYAFDQCLAPSQKTMNAWLTSSPFLGVGIYISGASRACRSQPNLTPSWVHTQLAKGWRLLPLTMGPQASCNPRFPRYNNDPTIDPKPGAGNYQSAREQGRATAVTSVKDAQALGIVPGSTLWYDLEGYDNNNAACRESALAFLTAWTKELHDEGFRSGVYSSAGSGIVALDNARVSGSSSFTAPDQIWFARWDGVASVSSSYLRPNGWLPGGRMKQYQGGHDEKWGGVSINIDRNWMNLGTGSVAAPETHCGGVTISFKDYPRLSRPVKGQASSPALVKALQCLLVERAGWKGRISGTYTPGTIRAVQAYQSAEGVKPDAKGRWFSRDWMSILALGETPVQKIGSAGGYVRRIQRALNASGLGYDLTNTGVYDSATIGAVRAYQHHERLPVTGVVAADTWAALIHGKR